MITEDYVSFGTAKLLKENGFDEPCECLYDTENNDVSIVNGWMNVSNSELEKREFVCYSAPTLQMAMKWLRKIHNIIIVPTQYHKYMKKKVCDEFYYGCLIFKLNTDCPLSNDNFLNKKYEKSCDSAIKYCLENLI